MPEWCEHVNSLDTGIPAKVSTWMHYRVQRIHRGVHNSQMNEGTSVIQQYDVDVGFMI